MNSSVNEVRPTVESRRKHNVCGECQECCWLYTIAEVQKPRMTRCRHQCDTGCAIHDQERPPACTGFQCAWLYEEWAPELRPDRSRIIWQWRGAMPDRWGRPHQVWLGDMLNRYAYLARVNERWCERLVSRHEIVCLRHIAPYPDLEKMEMSRCSAMVFPGLRTAALFQHIREYTSANDGENVARNQAFIEQLRKFG